MTDHDLLVRIDERVNKLDGCMTSHLQRHERIANGNRAMFALVAVAVIAALGSLMAALVG